MIPEISIVIPAYKAVPFIGRLLSQIYAQDFDKNFECIVVDDCSPDDTPGAFRKAAESCPPHIDLKYIRNEVVVPSSCGTRTQMSDSPFTFHVSIS